MTDVHKLIDSILSDPRLANSRAFSGKMYEDEPILRTGSQMKNYLPQRYRDMKALARPVTMALITVGLPRQSCLSCRLVLWKAGRTISLSTVHLSVTTQLIP